MKCIILAGGQGERLWPLSRKNNPKQFIQIQNNHSLFQETIARNLPFCDEFIIVTDEEYRYIVDGQISVFQGLTYRVIYETNPEGTMKAVCSACNELQPSELVFVVDADYLFDERSEILGNQYREAIIEAKKLVAQGNVALIGMSKDKGILVFEVGTFLQNNPNRFNEVNEIFGEAVKVDTELSFSGMNRLEDIVKTDYVDNGLCVKYNSNSTVINNTDNQAVVLNGVDDLMVINTLDAVYVGKYGQSDDLKLIMAQDKRLFPYVNAGAIFYRSWGYYHQLLEENTYRIRKVVLFPGRTIYAHAHNKRNENWTILEGIALITINDVPKKYTVSENVDIPIGTVHQISNIGTNNVVFVETASGEIIKEADMISANVADIDENQLGWSSSPFIKLSPAYKDYLWGGTKLRDVYNKNCEYDIIAESWELSAHPDGQSIVASGKHKGMHFADYLTRVGKEVLGWKCKTLGEFPLLIKFIDAKGDLSVQVHPDDEYAMEHEQQYGKNEMWYILDCEEDSKLYLGFNRQVSREEVKERIENNTITEVLNQVDTHPGEVYFIPAGTVHAIGAGNLICEVQQSSNCTYRLYDYDRKDKYGKKRELHIEKALDVLDYSKYEQQEARCKYFEANIEIINGKFVLPVSESHFLSVVCIAGEGTICGSGIENRLCAGDSFFVKAQCDEVIINGDLKVIISHI